MVPTLPAVHRNPSGLNTGPPAFVLRQARMELKIRGPTIVDAGYGGQIQAASRGPQLTRPLTMCQLGINGELFGKLAGIHAKHRYITGVQLTHDLVRRGGSNWCIRISTDHATLTDQSSR